MTSQSVQANQRRVVVVGGVAGGMSAAARLRRLDEYAEILVLERDDYVSFANCGLPYHIGGEIENREALLLQTPQSLSESLALDVRTGHEVMAIERETKRVRVVERATGRTYHEAVRPARAGDGRETAEAAACPASTTRASSRCDRFPTWTRSRPWWTAVRAARSSSVAATSGWRSPKRCATAG